MPILEYKRNGRVQNDLELNNNGSSASINDNTTSEDSTWSSKKINSSLNNIANELKLTGSGNTIKLMLGTKELSSITISNGTVEPNPTTYNITNNLTNCSNSNTATSIEENTSYTATITPNTNYAISSITVSMGGVDITSSAVSNNTINIASVTGDIVITASTTEIVQDTVVGSIDSNNDISLTGLDAGTYTLKYEDASGNVLDSFDTIAEMEVV